MDKASNFEKGPSRERVVAEIAEKGLANSEAKEFLNKWIAETSERMDAEDKSPLSKINFQIELAKLLLEAGEKAEAEEVLWDVVLNADSEAHTDTPVRQQAVDLKNKASRMLEEI
ncbi:MAG: hypothetical protein LiPW15_347 [Parcubacteria group bacterium LiPW_15]|nr:MAG: hypothetical protein LiPW15_347 [Parcubacteria group bacterium LiPW_15]